MIDPYRSALDDIIKMAPFEANVIKLLEANHFDRGGSLERAKKLLSEASDAMSEVNEAISWLISSDDRHRREKRDSFCFHRKDIAWGGQLLTLETGKVARQADGAVMARLGDTIVLCTVVGARSVKPGQ
ncbi:MAG: polyribonucleotide nucleotidyltransferase, partial [Spirosoma sp.]|nr:polyribonucleotide nucleotidyltransferase [Spirosoma sp.]